MYNKIFIVINLSTQYKTALQKSVQFADCFISELIILEII